MLIEVHRVWETTKSVCGKLYVDGQYECVTLEPSRLFPYYPGHPCIPAGQYRVILTPSPELGYVTPELLNVLGRSFIRIHVGNFPKDVKGCTAVGETHALNTVISSQIAFDKLMTLLRAGNGETITAVYLDPPAPTI